MARKYTTAQSTVLRRLLDGWPEADVIRGALNDAEELLNIKSYHHCMATDRPGEITMHRVIRLTLGGFKQQHWRIAANGHAWRTL
jgi:hypothetical protein